VKAPAAPRGGADTIPPGTLLNDRYRIVGLLGRSALAVTYLAEDRLLGDKRRAVKEVPEALFDEAESRVLSRVQHPALPDVTDRFGLEGRIYLVLDFDGSQTLEGVRRRAGGRVELARVGRWVAELCDLLAYLHEHEPPIVLRDLGPESILLDESGRIVVVDLGLPGTAHDPRSDVNSLAVTIYALLAGAPPPEARERARGREVPPPSSVVAGLPAALDDVLLTAMSLDVHGRHASVRDFERAFLAAVGEPPADAAGS
jgi:serine/threonine-protein kinase